jgi:CheY-like chemotaxis protein
MRMAGSSRLTPARTAPEAEPASAVAPHVPARPRRILVVDDNLDSGEMLAEALTRAGHELRVLSDPTAALEAVQEFAPDVVVLDLGMPVLDGYELAAQLRGRLGERAPALIALTGYGGETERARTAASGFFDHFVKPVDLRKLTSRIAELA